ncbi:MAG: hypothetical protein Q7U05_08780 [Polaromonas sp.]|nr:hypothetical protein [Polaromonas sp.]
MRGKELDDPIEIDETVSWDLYAQLSQSDDFDRQLCNLKSIARDYSFDQLLERFALAQLEADTYKRLFNETNEFFEKIDRNQMGKNWQKSEMERLCDLVEDIKKAQNSLVQKMYLSGVKTMEIKASRRAKKAANFLHSKPGGSHEKKAAILKIWASGKYWSRDLCAEEECAGIGLSYSKTRKHLIGTPDNPNPKPTP